MLRRALLLSLMALPLLFVPSAHAKSCNISGKERKLGATYVTSLSVKRTSCGKGEGVVKAYHACRGSKQSCSREVNGFSCSQKKLATSPLQYDARVTCKKGRKRVKHVYTQNT